jgi:hypothetical protein
MLMKNYAVTVLSLLLFPVCCTVLALTENELAYLDNLTSDGAYDTTVDEGAYRSPPSYDDWYLSRLRHFPLFYHDPYYAYYYPYSDPYTAACGYPWRYYDEGDYDGWYDRQGRSGTDLSVALEKMRQRRQDRWDNFQSFMLDRRQEVRESIEDIRDSLQDLSSRDCSFDSRLPGRGQRSMGPRGQDRGRLFRGGRR